MKRYITEFIGTFFLVLTIGLTVTQGSPMAPLAIGSVLMVMVYMGGHLSGAHYNPAASFGVFLLGKLGRNDLLIYWASQVLGGLAAAGIVGVLVGETFAPAPGAGHGAGTALLAELLFTFALVTVILNVAVARATQGNSYFGLAIGFTVMTGAFAVGPISGAAFNPAVGLGPTIVHAVSGAGDWNALWIYIVGPLVAAAAAAAVFRLQEGGQH